MSRLTERDSDVNVTDLTCRSFADRSEGRGGNEVSLADIDV